MGIGESKIYEEKQDNTSTHNNKKHIKHLIKLKKCIERSTIDQYDDYNKIVQRYEIIGGSRQLVDECYKILNNK